MDTGDDAKSGQRAVRNGNLALILRRVRRSAPCSRADVAAATGLTKSTVSSIVGELIERGLLRETGAASGERRVGRPGVMLEVDPRSVAAIGLEVNVDYLTVVAVDLVERELFARHADFDAAGAGPETGVRRLADLIASACADPLLAGRVVVGAGIAVPGLVDAASGTVTRAPNLRWRDLPLRGLLAAELDRRGRTGVPVAVDNDANLAVVAEYRGGHLAGTPGLVYITGEVGIGAGVLVDGRPLRGTRGYGGEIGHMPLTRGGPLCGCGRRGCLEALAGIAAILRRTAPGLLPGGSPGGAAIARAVRETADRAGAGDAEVLTVLADAGDWLGRGAAVLANLLDPRAVILGGYFVPLAPWLLPACEAALTTHVLAPPQVEPLMHTSTLGLNAAARGAAAALLADLDRGRLPFPPLGARSRAGRVPGRGGSQTPDVAPVTGSDQGLWP
ncbi:ROK family protein [Nocardiopsis mangrovi]|uniref:ROK family protein n=1 Tax=Nocardiopsis mangrovi TaxID=1179818 RepID=A0ABV9DUD7_9ACTN